MTTYKIRQVYPTDNGPSFHSWYEVAAISASPGLNSGDKVFLYTDLTFSTDNLIAVTDTIDRITIPTGATFEGNNKTIYFSDSSLQKGFLEVGPNGVVKNLTVDYAGRTYNDTNQDRNSIFLRWGSDTQLSQYGDYDNITLQNATYNTSDGGIFCTVLQNGADFNKCAVINCQSTESNNSAVLYEIHDTNIRNCYFEFSNGSNQIAIINNITSDPGTVNIKIEKCYTQNANYIFQNDLTNSTTTVINISQCYFLGSSAFANAVTGTNKTINISDTYITLPVIITNNFGSGNELTFDNGYLATLVSAGYLCQTNSGIITLNEIYVNDLNRGTSFITGGTPPTFNGGGLDISVIDEAVPSEWNSTTIWSVATSDYPILQTFENTAIWDGTYNYYLDTPQLLAGQSSGDPHIFTLTKKYYDYNKLGYSRFFDSGSSKNRLIINCEITPTNNPKWKELDYFSKLYIKYNNSELLFDMGFRGKPITLQYQSGDEIPFTMVEDGIHTTVPKHCMSCSFSTKDQEEMDKHLVENEEHTQLPLIRNKVLFSIPGYYLRIENVSAYNRQPCRIFFTPKSRDLHNFQGIIVDPCWGDHSQLDSIYDVKQISIKDETIKTIDHIDYFGNQHLII